MKELTMKLKYVIGFACVALLGASAVQSAPRNDKYPPPRFAAGLTTDAFIDANKIFSYLTNDGGFARDFVGQLNINGGGGMVYPYAGLANIANGQANSSCIFAAGLWAGAIDSVSAETLITMSEFSSEFTPGTMVGGTFSADDPRFRPYKLYKDSMASNPNADYTNWPVADGAPVDSAGNPLLTGDQMVWSVFNDADPSKHTNDAGSTSPMGIEVQQSTFGFNREDALGNIIFLRYKITNKGSKTLQKMFISLWCDPDLGGFTDDLVGSDVDLSLGYCYNSSNNDQVYGSNPPAVGFDFFQGPLDSTGDMADTAIMWGQKFPGFRNFPLASFNKYINGTDPNNRTETYGFMNGLDKSGAALIDPTTSLPTKFFGNGDPTTGQGFLDSDPADRRFMLSTGPITFRPGDSTEVIAAVIVGQAIDRLTSISLMKFYDKFAQSAYELNFNLPVPPDPPVVEVSELSNEVVLSWGNKSEVNHGTYPFQGYTVYQGESPTGPWKTLRTSDIADGNAIIFDDQFDLSSGLVLNKPVQLGNDGGIRREISITQDAIGGGRLANSTDYWFRVEAYTFDPVKTPKVLTTSVVVGATPQGDMAGTTFNNSYADTLSVTHLSGSSDGAVMPFVVDPGSLIDASYNVIFHVDTTSGNTLWDLVRDTGAGPENVVTNQLNQTGDNDYMIIDGLLVKVTGPSVPGMKDWDIPAGTRRFTWASADFGFEGFSGAMGWGSPFGVFGGGAEPVSKADLKNVLLVLAQVDTLGNFDAVNDTNVSFAYRHGRGFGAPPAQPGFAPFIVNTAGAGYDYQDFTKSVPLSAWNMDVTPPQRLAVGFLENNAVNGLVDGKWFPGDFNNFDNVAGSGPREWLWIYDAPYSTTPDPNFQVEIIGNPTPVMWWLTPNRRGNVPFSPGGTGEDQFLILANKVNTPVDTFTFTSVSASTVASLRDEDLSRVKTVPNPYYLFSNYEADQFSRDLRFTNLPPKCTIRIFSLSGELVRTLDKDDASQSWMTWNTQTDNGLPVASGIYMYIVTAPNGAKKIGKMAIFTESEQLQNF